MRQVQQAQEESQDQLDQVVHQDKEVQQVSVDNLVKLATQENRVQQVQVDNLVHLDQGEIEVNLAQMDSQDREASQDQRDQEVRFIKNINYIIIVYSFYISNAFCPVTSLIQLCLLCTR